MPKKQTSKSVNCDKEYEKIFKISRHARILQGISSLLDWDQETFMPPAAAQIRSEQLELLAGIIHRERTSKKFATALNKLIDIKSGEIKAKELTAPKKAALKEWRGDYIHNTAIPATFVEEFAKVTSQGVLAWRSAKQTNSFNQFAPFLDKIVDLCRKKAEYIGYKEHPYDALLDQFEPGITTKEVNTLFTKVRDSIAPLIKKIAAKKQVNDQFLHGNWDQDKQIIFSHRLLEAMEYDKQRGRLDFSSHPFSSSAHPKDSRITTRIHPTCLISNLFVILHEGGHGLYEMGLPESEYGSPLGEARSLGMHESQSRWWETRIGMSKPFWQYFFPLLKETFKKGLEHVTLDEFYLAINKVEPSFIRVDADEMTYPLHVILRFELERDLIAGTLKTREIPDAWNAKMEKYLGIIPENNHEGCLQDIHWSMGGFGYFPTYTLGNLYAAHLFNGFTHEHADWEKRLASGDLSFIKLWLHEKVFQHGRRYSSLDLLKNATGKTFSVDPYLDYLKGKYTKIYNLS